MELVLAMHKVYPYFSLKNSGKKCSLYTAKYSKLNSHPHQSPVFN